MENKIFDLIKEEINSFDLILSSVYFVKEDNVKFLRIEIDSKNSVTLEDCVNVTKRINPIIDDSNLIKEFYVLDVCSKRKGDSNE